MKKSINDVLNNHPGIGLAKIAEFVDDDKSIIQSVLRAMVQNKELKTRGERRGMVYFLENTDLRTVPR